MLAMSSACSATRWPARRRSEAICGVAAHHQRDVGAGAAHVEQDQVGLADQARGVAAAGDPARGAREHAARGEAHGVGDGRDAAVGLDDQDRPAVAGLDEPRLEAAEIALQRRTDVGVDHRGADALVLLDLREHRGGRATT